MRRISTLAIMLMALPVYAQPTFGFMELLNATDVPEEFSQPVAVAVDANGNVYVAAFASNNAFKITPDDTVTEIINGVGAGMGSTLNGPIDIAVDSVGNVYIAGNLSNNVFMITPDLVVTEIMNKDSNGPNTLLGTVSIAVDSSLNVYVAGDASNNAFKIEPDATITEIIDNTGDGTSNLVTPHGIAVGPNGNVYVSGFGTGSRNAFEITPGGAISEIIDGTGAGGGKILGGADGVAVDSAGNVYVVGNLTDNVFRITPSGGDHRNHQRECCLFSKGRRRGSVGERLCNRVRNQQRIQDRYTGWLRHGPRRHAVHGHRDHRSDG